MSFTFVGRAVTSEGSFASGASFALPPGTLPGDLLTISVMSRGNHLVNLPAGWIERLGTNNADDFSFGIGRSNVRNGYIIRGASNPATALTGWTGNIRVEVTVLAYRPVGGAAVEFVAESTFNSGTWRTAHDHDSIPSLQANDLLVMGLSYGRGVAVGGADAALDPATASDAASGGGSGALAATGMPAPGAWLNRHAFAFVGGDSIAYACHVADGVMAGAGATGTLTASTGGIEAPGCGSTMAFRTVAPPAPVITGPSGAAGAASITTSSAENQNVAGVWTASGTGTWSLSGTDAALLSIAGGTVTKASGTFDADAATGGKSSYSFTVNYGTASQAVTLNITDINEAPSFIGPAIGALVFTVGTPITPVPLATLFVDPEGLAITASIVESLAGTGLSVVSGQLQGTPAAPQAATSYTPRGADPAGNGTNGTAFTIAIQAAGTAPSITTQPQSQTVTAGANVTFSVAATGSGTLSYQWRRNGVNIAGANSSSYTLATVLGDSGAVFSVVVSGDTAPPATSANATLTVNAAPTFSALTDVIAESGINLAEGTTVFWTWYPSGRPGAAAAGINGTSQVNAQGRALISHTQAGAGMVLLGTRPGPTVADDRVYLDFLTLA